VLARDELAPVLDAFSFVLGSAGLRRGSTVVIESSGSPGATSVAVALLAATTTAGGWCAIVGLPAPGLVAASELGLALDRVVLVPMPPSSPAKVLAALLEGCEIVLVTGWAHPNPSETRRLAAVARERRSILLAVSTASSGARARWPDPPDVVLRVLESRPRGVGDGAGHLHSRLVVVEGTRRRISPRTVSQTIWLPSSDGSILPEERSRSGVVAETPT
jgi:hypothetical protein